MKHASQCLERLIRLLLGPDAVADDKTDVGERLIILGVDITLSCKGFTCAPAELKVTKWLTLIDEFLKSDRMLPGEASKMAGRLSWACSQLFKRFGRAMLRPIFDQQSRRDGRISGELRKCLVWWKEVLSMGISELRTWSPPVHRTAHMFVDASGSPAHLGAVLFIDDTCWWTHMDPPKSILGMFKARKDNQIMGLELLSISLGLCSFQDRIRDRKLVIHCDNRGAEVCCSRKGCIHEKLLHFVTGVVQKRMCENLGPCAISSPPVEAGGSDGARGVRMQGCH